MEELAIKIEHVSKQYRLGLIGGGTLQADIESWWARKHGKEDPNSKIGAENKKHKVGEKFLALDDINLEVKKGEALGIIGHNGAGKSTLLKLLSRVTAPTEGTISYNGRITSMLEVGTGFHRELTGRENIYMNGAILGMSRKETDAKIEQIIDFSEVRQFIDTPVKRYSSGMYVKLAFSVAAHLDSEIMIMDEVLAVGDMAFQKKCLAKMREAATKEGRTVLYVSHNMNTIRQLCDRCVVLEHGHIIFDGDVEQAISLYSGGSVAIQSVKDYSQIEAPSWLKDPKIKLLLVEYLNSNGIIDGDTPLRLHIRWRNLNDISQLCLRIETVAADNIPCGTYTLYDLYSGKADSVVDSLVELNVGSFAPAQYQLKFVFFEKDRFGNNCDVGFGRDMYFEKRDSKLKPTMLWNPKKWGYIIPEDPEVLEIRERSGGTECS